MPATLGYWNVRGLAQPIRLLLEYTGTVYTEKTYTHGPEPGSAMTPWPSVKDSLGLDFPKLPYYIDGQIKITQTNAILRYIARQNNLCGETEEQRVRVDIMENSVTDVRNAAVMSTYFSTNYEETSARHFKALPTTLKQFSSVLGSNQWFTGNKITFVDFSMYEVMDWHRIYIPTIFDGTENIKDFLSRFEALPQIAAYMKSDRFLSGPISVRKDGVTF